MRKLSILISHWRHWKWLPIAIHAFKTYPFSIESEILVADNSPGHPSIKTLTETYLGEGIKIIDGDPDMPSHGQGYSLCFEQADGDWIMTSETDAFPFRHGWGEEYIKASADFDYIGPHMSLAGGHFIHPAGTVFSRTVVEDMQHWMQKHSDWVFVPGAAVALGLSDKPYHVNVRAEFLETLPVTELMRSEMKVWKRAGAWQCMLSFDDDSFETYPQRSRIEHWEPHGKDFHLRIGYEPGMLLALFAQEFHRCLHAPHKMIWMDGWKNRQAEQTDVFGGYRHIWCGTSSECDGIDPSVRFFKRAQLNYYFAQLPLKLQNQITALERQYA